MSVVQMNEGVRLQQQDFDVGREIKLLVADRSDIGAVVSFVGFVREFDTQSAVTALELEHYPGMTERSLAGIVRQARVRWSLTGVRVVHRYGVLAPTDQIVLVLTASAHRHVAFEANAFIMDYLKTQAPFWKKEHRGNDSLWVQARQSDEQALMRWVQ